MSQFVNFSEQELAADAGDDPWKLNGELQSGDPGAINDLADAFHQAGMHVKEADDEFEAAKRKFLNAYQRNGSEHPINASDEVQRTAAALKGHPEELSKIAADLEQLAAALAEGQRNSDGALAGLENYLHGIDDQITANPDARAELYQSAVVMTGSAAVQLEEIRGAYVAQMEGAEAAMMASGYAPEAIDGVDGVDGNAPNEVSQRYDQSGQRARDQALVDRATREGRTKYLPSAQGTPGFMSQDEADAAQRLQDYKAITDPTHGYAHHDVAKGDVRSERLAAQRLDDYMVANSTGSVAKDPVLGGDARTRAAARLTLQRNLENGSYSGSQPMTPDQATQLMDQMEVTDRANVLVRLQESLQQAGMSPDGSARVTDGIAHGVIPQEFMDAAGDAGRTVSATEQALERFREAVPTGLTATPDIAPYSSADLEAIKGLGHKLGVVGNALDLGIGAYEIMNGAPPGEVVAKTGGGMAGAWILASAGAELGAAGGPPGVFICALLGGTIGAIGGEDAGERLYDWLAGE